MTRTRWAQMMLAVLMALPHSAHAQIGGLIKRKVADAVKPKEEQAPKAETGDASPFKYELTAETMAAFKRGLELELKMRREYRARVAKHTSDVETRKKCQNGIPTRPEAAKIAEEGSSRMDKATTPAETQAAMKWMQDAMLGLMTKVCGAEPALPPDQTQSFNQAQEAGAIEFGKGATRKPPRDKPSDDSTPPREECLERDDSLEGSDAVALDLLSCGDDSSSGHVGHAQQQQLAPELLELFLHEYGLFKELVTKFCSLDRQTRADAVKNGIQVQGSHDKIFWVFSKEFATMVNPDCQVLMDLLAELM